VANFVADPQYIQQGVLQRRSHFFAQRAGIETRVVADERRRGFNPYRVMFTTQDFSQAASRCLSRNSCALLCGGLGATIWSDPASAHAVIIKLNPALNPEWMQFSWQALRDGHFITGDGSDGSQLGQMRPERWTTMFSATCRFKDAY